MNIWETVKIETNQVYFKQIGPLQLWITRKNDDWLVASKRDLDEREKIASEILESLDESEYDWQRLIPSSKGNEITPAPTMPDRPVIVKPESPLRIAANAEALFYVLIPIWIRIYPGTSRTNHLFEIPTVQLSKTWFGEPHDGELCYSSKTSARRTMDGVIRRPHQVVCPVHVTNTASTDLEFKRLRIDVSHLSIFDGENQMCTNLIKVVYKGSSQLGQVSYESKPPILGTINKNNKLLSKARLKGRKEFFRRNFDTFKFLTGS